MIETPRGPVLARSGSNAEAARFEDKQHARQMIVVLLLFDQKNTISWPA
jgi:hypothetical protein